MPRKIIGYEDIEWSNPLKTALQKPYLGDLIWPDDQRGPSWEKTVSLLKLFYCDKRGHKQEDLAKIENFLQNPEKYMIVWGEVGIGKTWFLRYELNRHQLMSNNAKYYSGVVDMLSEGDVEYGVFKQLRYILESYFAAFHESTSKALESYIKFDYAKLKVKKEELLSDAELIDVKNTLKRWLELRNEPAQSALFEYVKRLLDALQHLNLPQLLILLVDNIDKTREDEQERLVKLAVRLLRHPQIRLIIPLRKSSKLLADRFSVLREFTFEEMELFPLDIREMLRIRFHYSRDGKSLAGSPKIIDLLDDKEYTFPLIFSLIFGEDEKNISESGKLILERAGDNARESLHLTERLIYSDQLKGLKNIYSFEYSIAALMLSDKSQPPATSSGVINLFNNDAPNLPGNALIRFRVLEYFWEAENSTTSDERFKVYFRRLGYDLSQVKNVIELFVMTQLIASNRGLSPDDIKLMSLEEIGPLTITKSGLDFKNLLRGMWYYVSVKKDVYLPEIYINKNANNIEYCTHSDFVRWLEEQEKTEKQAILKYERTHGTMKIDWALRQPSKLASKGLRLEVRKKIEELG